MTAKSLLKLLLLAFPLSLPAMADSNLIGDEIIILDDGHLSPATSAPAQNAAAQNLPVQDASATGYLPDNSQDDAVTAEQNATVATEDLWQRIKDGYALPEQESPYTANHESWYAARPDYVKRMLERSQKYLYHVVEEVQKRGMPTEIALLPMVESAFNPQAYSRSHASGIWQFMPATGQHFGLKQTWWIDNRRDVTAATDAALTYLQKLHVMFGSWDLALAAYNAGEGTVMRAIESNRRKGLPTDYAHLPLPPETRNYVPKLQAIKNLVNHPERFGVEIKPLANQPYFTKVSAPKQIDASLAAKLAGISLEEFSSLNPEYNRPVLTTLSGTHEFLLPVGAAETFTTNLASYDQPLVSWQTYHAKRGELMVAIARKFGMDVDELRNVNSLPVRNKLISAKALLVPSDDDKQAIAIAVSDHAANGSATNTPAEHSRIHIVKNGENLQLIASRYGMSVKQLMTLNRLKSSHIKIAQKLLIDSDAVTTRKLAVNRKATHYVVKRGDTLDGIARKFDVALDDLQRWNNIKGSRIVPGHQLTVTSPDEA